MSNIKGNRIVAVMIIVAIITMLVCLFFSKTLKTEGITNRRDAIAPIPTYVMFETNTGVTCIWARNHYKGGLSCDWRND